VVGLDARAPAPVTSSLQQHSISVSDDAPRPLQLGALPIP